jgi:heme exporter protein A
VRLSCIDLAASRGGRTVFEGLSFSIAPGSLLAVTGPNGVGKSTLLRVIAGLLRPDRGEVRLDPPPDAGGHAAIHYLGHLDALKRAFTVRENVAFWRTVWDGTGNIDEALDTVGLFGRDHLPVATLSAGQRRRVAIARLLVAARPLWLLDEPATALDAAGEAMLGRVIHAHLETGGLVVAATHRDLAVSAGTTLALEALP